MFVFKLSWLPYMLIIAGIYFLTDGQIGAGLVFCALGGGWLYSRFSNKPAAGGKTGSTKQIESDSVYKSSTPQSAEKKMSKKFCQYCGAEVDLYDMYCSACGKKI